MLYIFSVTALTPLKWHVAPCKYLNERDKPMSDIESVWISSFTSVMIDFFD